MGEGGNRSGAWVRPRTPLLQRPRRWAARLRRRAARFRKAVIVWGEDRADRR